MTKLPIPLARCPRRYEDMTPTSDASRHCAQCDRPVHDLSARTREEAARLLASGDDLCVRYLHDADGRVLHRGKRALAILALAATPLLTEACGGAPRGYHYDPTAAADAADDPPSEGDADEDGAP